MLNTSATTKTTQVCGEEVSGDRAREDGGVVVRGFRAKEGSDGRRAPKNGVLWRVLEIGQGCVDVALAGIRAGAGSGAL